MKIRPAANPEGLEPDDIVIVNDDPWVRASLIMIWHGPSDRDAPLKLRGWFKRSYAQWSDNGWLECHHAH
ncbi:MAG TPA: hypothetical protein VIQ76_12795 [Propionibacteriaceae bacterium]